MPIPLAGAILGSSLLSGFFGNRAADAQADAARDAANYQAQIGQYAFDRINDATGQAHNRLVSANTESARYLGNNLNAQTALNRPYQQMGGQGRNQLMGLNPNLSAQGITTNPNIGTNPTINTQSQFTRNPNLGSTWGNISGQNALSNFQASPDYQFRLNEGLDAVQNSAAAQGTLHSGDTLRGITDYASNLASGEYADWFGRQQGLGDRQQGLQADNFARESGQFADNYSRGYGQASDNYLRQYGQASDNYARDFGQQTDARNFGYGVAADNYGRGEAQANQLIGYGLTGDSAQSQNLGNYYGGLSGNAQGLGANLANLYTGQAATGANALLGQASGVANSMQNQGAAQASGWAALNNAATSGIGNYLYGAGQGWWGQKPSAPVQTSNNLYNSMGNLGSNNVGYNPFQGRVG